MRILRHLHDVPEAAKGAVVALGNFDGVHVGHRALIAEAARVAREKNVPLAVMVFEPYPREFFQPNAEPFRLTPFRDKARLLADIGVDWLIVIEFDRAMAGMAAQDFVMNVLVRDLAVSHVVIGSDFLFGRSRAGDSTVLAYMGEMEGFGVTVFDPVIPADGAGKVSSTNIREALKDGRMDDAAKLLGHWWTVEGHVAHGDKRGRTLGFPTANLSLEHYLQPKHGVYAVRAHIASNSEAVGEKENHEDGHGYGAVASFGLRPMYALEKPQLEVFLFDFSGDLYGKLLRVEFIRFLRGEQVFADTDALVAQMNKDSDEARRVLAGNQPS